MTAIKLQRGDIVTTKADAIIVNLFKGVKAPGGATGAVDAALGGAIKGLLDLGDFKGRLKEISVIPTHGKIAAKRVILVGLGERKEFSVDAIRQVAARSAIVARDRGCASAATILHGAGVGRIDAAQAAHALTEGALLGLYEFKEYRSKPKEDEDPEKDLKELWIIEQDAAKVRRAEPAVREAEALARITNDVRTLVNRPSLDKTPPVLVGSSRVDLQACKLEYSIVSPK